MYMSNSLPKPKYWLPAGLRIITHTKSAALQHPVTAIYQVVSIHIIVPFEYIPEPSAANNFHVRKVAISKIPKDVG